MAEVHTQRIFAPRGVLDYFVAVSDGNASGEESGSVGTTAVAWMHGVGHAQSDT